MKNAGNEVANADICHICQRPFSEGETVVQAMEDRHPTCHKEIVRRAYHRSCAENCETGHGEVAGGRTF
jgi:hypothetical protein